MTSRRPSPLDRETYESFKEQFGEDTERTLAAAHNLASSLRLVGDYFEARALDQETLDRQRRALPPDHPYTLLSAAAWPSICAPLAPSGSP